jgi:2-keto-4-pentenoate hydratase/2-oxohepta-3-ene-1,7-dioic acid hydratase in catechol pathway
MKLAQFKTKDSAQQRLGILIGDVVCDVAELARAVKSAGGNPPDWLLEVTDTLEVIKRGSAALEAISSLLGRSQALGGGGQSTALRTRFHRVSSCCLSEQNPRDRPQLRRTRRGRAEQNCQRRRCSLTKLPNALSAHNAPIVLPIISEQVDFEAELAVIIGRTARRVSEAEALEYIFGYSLINDVSARDLQFGDGQWTRGKSLDTFAPLGPFITTRDEIEDVQTLKIEGVLNGEVMQSSNTSKMIFKVAYLVSYLSQGITLQPGDVIASGTPDGVGIFRKPPVLLKAGDVFEVKIEKVGALRNPVVGAD